MIEIKNPHSQKRLSHKEKFNKKFTDLLVPYIKKIQLQEDCTVESKFVPKVLKSAREDISFWETSQWTTEMPNDIELDLLSLYVAEYIPIENIDKLNKGLKKLIKKFPARYEHGQQERIDNFCNKVKQSIHGERWSNFGFIDIGKETTLTNFVKQLNVQACQITSSSVILQFVITPADHFLKEYKKVVKNDVKDHIVFTPFTPYFRNFFKSWGISRVPSYTIKRNLLEDLLIELKWRTMKVISNYFDMYFISNNLIPPSINVYKLKQLTCKIKEEAGIKQNHFWGSVGMDNSYQDISEDGVWSLYPYERGSHFIDCSLKVTCNTEIEREPMYSSLEHQIVYKLRDFSDAYLPMLVMREYAKDTSKKVAVIQSETFKSIKKAKPKYRKLINVRYELEQNIKILKRFKYEINNNHFNRIKEFIRETFRFESPRFDNIKVAEMIVDNTSYLVEETYNHSQHFSKMIDDTVDLLEIKTNNSLRRFTFSLTIITVILSIVATLIAAVSLYIQLSEETKDNFGDLFTQIYTFFF